MLPAQASSVIAHAGTVRDRRSGHGWRSRSGRRRSPLWQPGRGGPMSRGSRTATRRGRAGAGVPVARSTSVWRIAVSPRRLASPYVPPVDRLRSPRPSKP